MTSLTPLYGLGSYGRTGAAVLLGSPRSKIGSQGRIYNSFRTQAERSAYIAFLIKRIGPQPQANRNGYYL